MSRWAAARPLMPPPMMAMRGGREVTLSARKVDSGPGWPGYVVIDAYQMWRLGYQGQYDRGWMPNRHSRPKVSVRLFCVGKPLWPIDK